MELGLSLAIDLVEEDKESEESTHHQKKRHSQEGQNVNHLVNGLAPKSSDQLPLQLNLFPHTPWLLPHSNNPPSHLSLLWPTSSENVTKLQRADDQEEGEVPAVSSSPNNSAASSFQIDLCINRKGQNQYGKRQSDGEGCDQRASSRASDEDDNNSGNRKKLRLSKEQSAFLEESFKEHSTLNTKQKLALAKQLGLRPRQVEVWFQNRRARTKLKQTEIDREYMKRYCETLTDENKRLHKELQELRAFKTSNPFYMQFPATTLTMCPSCERVGTSSTSAISKTPCTIHTNGVSTTASSKMDDTINHTSISFPLSKPKFYPFVPT